MNILAGHSHLWAMGAPRPNTTYTGPRGLLPLDGCPAYFYLDANAAHPTGDYWNGLLNYCKGANIFIVWGGNQHFSNFLFESSPPFDFVEGAERPDYEFVGVMIPRRIVKAFLLPVASLLHRILDDIRSAGADTVTLVATPPPFATLTRFEKGIKAADVWAAVAKKNGVSIRDAKFTSSEILLKIWKIGQELVEEIGREHGARYVPIPKAALDDKGLLLDSYQLPSDFTHANSEFGELMLQQLFREGF